MARLDADNAVAQLTIDRADSTVSEASSHSPDAPPRAAPPRHRDLNKDLPFDPDEIAGLREQKRQYTKELQAARSKGAALEVDPNHAYPNFEQSTTLMLSSLIPVNVADTRVAGMNPLLDIKCGPLLRYVSTDYRGNKGPRALYTMLIVTKDGESVYDPAPILEIAGLNTAKHAPATKLNAEILHEERNVTFWRWKIYVNLIADERRLAYRINGSKEHLGFWVPGAQQPMRIVFYSCNGLSGVGEANLQASVSR